MIRKSFTYEGKRYYVKASTEKEANERLIRKKIELEEGRKKITKNTLLSGWFEEWYETYKIPSVSPGWAKTVKTIACSVILPDIGHLRLKDVKPLHLQRILNDKADMSQSYLRIIRIIMGEIFQAAVDNGLLLEDPSKGIVTPKGRKPQKRRAITEKERHYILKTCGHHRAGLFYLLMLYCGLRPGEAAALQWRSVDLDKRILTVDRSLKADGSIGAPKSDAGFRKVPIPEALAEHLHPGSPFELVCTNAHGEQLTKTSIKQQWKSFKRQLNIEMGCRTFRGELVPPYPVAEDLVPYCLRHTYCTDLQAAGVPINVARELMGHSDISITAKIYTHSSAESFSDAAKAIEALQRRRSEEPEEEKILEQI